MPLFIGFLFFVTGIGDPLRATFEGINFDRQTQPVKDIVHSLPTHRPDTTRFQFSSNSMPSPSKQLTQHINDFDYSFWYLVMDRMGAARLGIQTPHPLLAYNPRPVANGAGTQGAMPLLTGGITGQRQLNGSLFAFLLTYLLVELHHSSPKLEHAPRLLSPLRSRPSSGSFIPVSLSPRTDRLPFTNFWLALFPFFVDTLGHGLFLLYFGFSFFQEKNIPFLLYQHVY